MNWKKTTKWTLLILLALLVLITVSAISLLYAYRHEIRNSVAQNIRNSLGLNLDMEPARISLFSTWPDVSIRFKNVTLSSSIYKGPKENFLEAGNIYLSVNLRKLLFSQEFSIKQVAINNARIRLRINADSTRNFAFLKPKPDTTASGSTFRFDLKKVSLKNVYFSLVNDLKQQNFELNINEFKANLRQHDGDLMAEVTSEIKVGGLAFKRRKGPFLKNANANLDLKLCYFKKDGMLSLLPPSTANINGETYRVNAQLQTKVNRLYILAASDRAYLSKVAPLLNNKIKQILSNFNVEKPLKASALIGLAPGERQDPILVINASTENNNLSIGESKVQYTNLSLTGKIYSITRDYKYGNEEQGLIRFSPIKGNVTGLPFTATVSLRGLQHSSLSLNAGVLIESEKLQFDLAKTLHLRGSCLAHINYSGPAQKLNKKEFLGPEMSLVATLHFKDLYFQPRNSANFFKLRGYSQLKGQDLNITNLSVVTNGGTFVLKGLAGNFTSYVLGLSKTLRARLDLNSRSFDLSPYFGTGKEGRKALPGHQKTKGQKRPAEKGDGLDIQLKFSAEKLKAKGLIASQAMIQAKYQHHSLYFQDIHMKVCGGSIRAKGQLGGMQLLRSEFDIEDVNVSEFFSQMNNFGQQTIRAEQLEGKLSLQASFSADLDDTKKLIDESMRGKVSLQLRDGRLMNFEPLQNISQYVFRNRNFKDITFTEINEKFELKGQAMKIEEMEVASSVLNMFVSGVYHFTGNSVINVLVPWSNFKHRDKDYVAKSSGISAEDTKGIKLNFSGPPKKMKMGVGYKKTEF